MSYVQVNPNQQESCSACICDMITDTVYQNTPAMLIIEYPESNIKTSHKIRFNTDTGPVYLYLRGIVYHGSFHFTSCIVSVDGSTWYHDGRETGSICHPDSSLSAITDQGMRKCRRRNLVLAVYAQVQSRYFDSGRKVVIYSTSNIYQGLFSDNVYSGLDHTLQRTVGSSTVYIIQVAVILKNEKMY